MSKEKEIKEIKEPKIKSILISQNKPENGKSVFDEIQSKYKLKIDYRSFIKVEPLPMRELRKRRLNILNHTAVILNAKNAVDHFFRVVEEMKVDLPIDFKFFCMSEGIAMYIHKYLQVRKRKVFWPKTNLEKDFFNLINTHKNNNFLFPCSDIRKATIPEFFAKQNIPFFECQMYKTVSADLSDLENVFYDCIVFFSPADIKSLYENFPDFKQNNTRIAAFGESTQRAIAAHKLVCNIPAPVKEFPSIVMALESYLKKNNS